MQILTPEEILTLNPKEIPHHIAIIPDGNRRWAKNHLFEAAQGHKKGADRLMDIVRASGELGIKVVTFYLFSTENWSRPKREVQALFDLLETYLVEQRQTMIDHGVKLHTIGNLTPFPKNVLTELQETKRVTKDQDKINLVFALNYGSRDEIRRTVEKIVDAVENGTLPKDSISEAVISGFLDTNPWPDPEILIRTSGEFRLSNFLLWQISYAEICVLPTLWPDFTKKHLLQALKEFQSRERRGGA